jgi:hypothetical protein
LKKNRSVIVGRITELPQRTDDDIDVSLQITHLPKAGVEYCLNYVGDGNNGARNLLFSRTLCATFGPDKEQALAAT